MKLRWLLLIPFALVASANGPGASRATAESAVARAKKVCDALQPVYTSYTVRRIYIKEPDGWEFWCNF